MLVKYDFRVQREREREKLEFPKQRRVRNWRRINCALYYIHSEFVFYQYKCMWESVRMYVYVRARAIVSRNISVVRSIEDRKKINSARWFSRPRASGSEYYWTHKAAALYYMCVIALLAKRFFFFMFSRRLITPFILSYNNNTLYFTFRIISSQSVLRVVLSILNVFIIIIYNMLVNPDFNSFFSDSMKKTYLLCK